MPVGGGAGWLALSQCSLHCSGGGDKSPRMYEVVGNARVTPSQLWGQEVWSPGVGGPGCLEGPEEAAPAAPGRSWPP